MTTPLDPAGLVRLLSREARSDDTVPDDQAGPAGSLPASLGDERTGYLRTGKDQGALCFTRSDGTRFHALPFPVGELPGPVAIVTEDARRLATLLAHLGELGLGTSFAVAAGTGDCVQLTDWVSIAVRHPHTALLLLDIQTPEQPGLLANAIAPLSEQLPILRCRGTPATPERSLEASWWSSLGVLNPEDDAVAAAMARLLVGPLPAVGSRWLHLMHRNVDGPGIPHVERRACGDLEALIEATDAALSTTHFDAVIVSLPALTPAETSQILEASGRWADSSSEVSCVLTCHGGALATASLATDIPPSVAVLDGRTAAVALRQATRWPAESGTARLRALPGPADPSRLRRVAADVRRLPHLSSDPATQKEIAAGLGLPAAPHAVVRYLEDTLMASANLGFPIELTVWNPGGEAPAIDPVIAEDSTSARQAAESMLATARRTAGMDAALVLRPLPRKAPSFRVDITNHERFGPVVRIVDARGNARETVGLPGPDTYAACIGPLQLPPAHHQAACSALQQATEVAFVGHRVLAHQSVDIGASPELGLGPLVLATGGPLIVRTTLRWSRGAGEPERPGAA